MADIERLESKIKQKIDELNESLTAQCLLREKLKKTTKILAEVERLLRSCLEIIKPEPVWLAIRA